MRLKHGIAVLILAVAPIIVAWRAGIVVDAGRKHELQIGMEQGAADGFDAKIDRPSPPPPPMGFYCFFSLSDTNYTFIDGLWGDIRPPADSALWNLEMRRWETPATIRFDSLPDSGVISVDGRIIDSSTDTIVLPANKDRIEIEYSANKEKTSNEEIIEPE
jgi:hypothetical protein